MNTQQINLDQLSAHPANSNVMPGELVKKLAAHIEQSGYYPPLIVRPLSKATAGQGTPATKPIYQILDGHHRLQALQHLNHNVAECVAWNVNDREALTLLATLNRLQGQDDPRKRAQLIGSLLDHHKIDALAKLLPERIDQLKKLLEFKKQPPKPRQPKPLGQMPVAVHFFLLPEQKKQLNSSLHALGGTREQALIKLVEYHCDTTNLVSSPTRHTSG